MKTITLSEDQSKFARILLAANSLPLDKFITFQSHECKTIGAIMELRVMKKVSTELNVPWVGTMHLSKYRQFLTDVWVAAKGHVITVSSQDLIAN